MFLLGLAAALVASAMFNLGAALQALEARDQPRSLELRLSLLGRLLRRKLWLIGFALGLLGVGPQVLALATAPFVVVQPALVVGLLLLLAIGSRRLGERVTAASWVGVVAIVAGVALVAAGAPTHVETHRGWLPVLAVVTVLSLPGLLPFPLRHTRFDGPWLVIVACGLGFAATNVATKLMSDDAGRAHWLSAGGWAVVALGMGLAATLTGMTAFQRAEATVVVPVTTSLQTFLPLVLEPFFLREHWGSATLGATIAIGLAIAAAGTVLVSRTRSVSGLLTAASS
jgi:drug/metabolite transporter (DMT)-like permease